MRLNFSSFFYETIENAEIHQILQICIHCSENKSSKTEIHTSIPHTVLKCEQRELVGYVPCVTLGGGKDFWFAKKKTFLDTIHKTVLFRVQQSIIFE